MRKALAEIFLFPFSLLGCRSLLHRFILMELVKVFFLALLGITGILLMAGIVVEASQHGLGPSQLLAVIPCIIPSTLPFTIPATTLFATCVVYGRLAHDNEILAIKSSGINILKVVWPALILGVLMTGITFALYVDLIPYTHHLMRSMFLQDVEELLYSMLRRDRLIKHPKLSYEMYVRQVQGRKLEDALFMHRDGKGQHDAIARAAEAELRFDLNKGVLLVKMHHCYIATDKDGTSGYDKFRVWEVELPQDLTVYKKMRASDLTWEEILEMREDVAKEEEELETQIANHSVGPLLRAPPNELQQHVKNLIAIKQQTHQKLFSLNAEMQMRPALAMGCFFFVVVGCPVGIWFSRSDYLSAFITCFLPIVFVYYPLLLCGTNMAKSGRLYAFPAIWAPNLVMGVIALGLFRRLLKN
jgi:lipopolysaccharide export system permease protein